MNETIKKMLKTYKGNNVDLCYNIFNILKQSKQPQKDLGYFIEKVGLFTSNETSPVEQIFSMEDFDNLELTYGEYANGLLRVIVNKAHAKNFTSNIFYNDLWEKINSDSLSENDKVKAFILYKFASNPLLPYVELEKPLSMDNQKFNEIIIKNETSLAALRHILNSSFAQKTELSSLLLKEIQKINSFEEQCVLFSVILTNFTPKTPL